MKMLFAFLCLLITMSSAQTEEPTYPDPRDIIQRDPIPKVAVVMEGTASYPGVCSQLEAAQPGFCTNANSDCVTAYCRESDDACFVQNKEIGLPCEIEVYDPEGNYFMTPGICVDGRCAYSTRNSTCEGTGMFAAERTVADCSPQNFYQTWRFTGLQCPMSGSKCFDFGPNTINSTCWTDQVAEDADHNTFEVSYYDIGLADSCFVGTHDESCVIKEPGVYHYAGMTIIWTGPQLHNEERSLGSVLRIDSVTKNITPKMYCPSGFCRGTVTCKAVGPAPCGKVVDSCVTYPPTTSTPSKTPTGIERTKRPTLDPITSRPSFAPASSHGDPIIWTFGGECYDLNQDGLYIASSHPQFDHDVLIAVHNEFMREVQVIDKKTGRLMLSINNLGEVLNNGFPYDFEHTVLQCPPQDNDCQFMFDEYRFDAQQFQYIVQIATHDYLDQALSEGETGVHLDIFPREYAGFKDAKGYTGIYFQNPQPGKLHYCPAGSQRSSHQRMA